jgi:hypothetical protein
MENSKKSSPTRFQRIENECRTSNLSFSDVPSDMVAGADQLGATTAGIFCPVELKRHYQS